MSLPTFEGGSHLHLVFITQWFRLTHICYFIYLLLQVSTCVRYVEILLEDFAHPFFIENMLQKYHD